MRINVAIDGPAGAGKSTIARGAAAELGYVYVDTGALYRAIGLYALRSGKEPGDATAVEPLLPQAQVSLRFVAGEQRVLLNGEDVSQEIRTPEASMAASAVSAIPAVREFLFDLQKDIAKANNCIMDGRDIGTVVLPNAQVKVFLTATAEERARRRYKDLLQKDPDTKYEDVLADLVQRDYNDSHRAIAPLKPAQDSILLDTTGMTLEESIAKMIQLIKERVSHAEV